MLRVNVLLAILKGMVDRALLNRASVNFLILVPKGVTSLALAESQWISQSQEGRHVTFND